MGSGFIGFRVLWGFMCLGGFMGLGFGVEGLWG